MTHPQCHLAMLEVLKSQEDSSRQVVHGPLSVRRSPEVFDLAELLEAVAGERNANICLITACHENGT